MKNEQTLQDLFVGTYTDNGSDGIYVMSFDPANGTLSGKKLIAETSNPSYLAIDQDRRYLLAVNENDSGGVSSFRWNENNRELDLIDQEYTEGSYPCYVALSESAEKVAVANYGTGNVVIYNLGDGKFEDTPAIQQHTGKGTVEDRQEGPHAHFSQFGRKGKFMYAVDLGIDKVLAYPVDQQGKIGEGHTALKLDDGDGPRHLVFHPSKDLVFVVNELSSTVVAAKVDHETGHFEKIDKLSTLPEDFDGESYCADIHISADGRYLYASNRGHNSIATFSVADDGTLKLLGTESTNGDWPRNFVISPNGKYLLVANQRSNNIVVLSINTETGMLTPTGNEAEIPSPVCLKF